MRKQLMITFALMSEGLDLDKGIAVFKHKPGNGNAVWRTINVSLSSKVKNFILGKFNIEEVNGEAVNFKGREILDVVFTSEHKSKSFNENPFRLVQFVPGKNSDIPMNWRLEFVHEAMSSITQLTDIYDRKYFEFKERILPASKYRRSKLEQTDKKLKDTNGLEAFQCAYSVVCIK